MAFVEADLASITTVVSNSKRITRWVYDSSDDITAAGYFAAAGSTSGDGRLTAGDLIYNPTTGQQVIVSDAAAGTASTSVGAGRKLLRIPISYADGTAENDTGIDLPAQAIVYSVFVDVTTAEATGGTKTLDAGTDGSGSNDPDGWVDGISVATTGIKVPTLTNGSATLGVLLSVQDSANAGDLVPEPDSASGGESITWTPGSADWAEFTGFLCVEYLEIA